ncbi:hypothetical protein [Serratia proteamaculans]|jgi:hypothetical protein|uniref:hypothetical protein n=1 Tax=Serratia proteamaculans TaxID=28151 RepID=UPI002177A636|nr:hypothetical protein [Serratia proteamaculans]CAI1014088.1 Uncharacterised protein [Serratia proteamaculans]CAI1024273.1 Uncharacterised protein [Serratia proteamaculans]
MNEERMNYNEIRSGFMSCFYIYRRDNIKDSQNSKDPTAIKQSTEVGYAYYQWEDAYDLPIEMLMRDVFTLIMLAGCTSGIVEQNLRNGIYEILSKSPLDQLLLDVSDDEKSDLLYDMELLGLIEKPE